MTQGASTISQQFARAVVLDRSRTYGRKLREVWLAQRLEEKYGKQAILQAYLNHVYFGDGYYGVEAASRGYFAKPAAKLNAAESATLAALISRPSGYALRRTPARIRDRRDWVLRQMFEAGQHRTRGIRRRDRDAGQPACWPASAQRASIDPSAHDAEAPTSSAWSPSSCIQQFGTEKALTGGLRVYTTLDTEVQQFAEAAVMKRLTEIDKRRKEGEPLQAALVAIEPATGYVRAVVGGRSFAESPFNRATMAKRQPGSAFKPFVFAAALEAGFSPGTTIDGLDAFVDSAQGAYLPGGEHEVDSTTLRSALVTSSNRAAVHLMQRVGLRPTIDLATRVGLSEMPEVPSLALGTGEVSLLKLTVGLHRVCEWRRAAAAGDHSPHRRSRRPRVVPRRRAGPSRVQRIDRVPDGVDAVGRRQSRHRLRRAPERLPLAGRRQDRQHRRPCRRVVRRLHAAPRGRRVDGLRPATADHAPRLRERRRRAGLGRLHEGGDHRATRRSG